MPTSGSYFTGYFGQVVLLNTALSAADVTAVFSRTSPQYIPSPPSPPPPSPSPPPLPPAPPPPLTYAQFPGCNTAVNGQACLALADLYVATQLRAGVWAAALSAAPAPGANSGGWAFSTANYCAWSGVGCAVATTSLACASDAVPNCIIKSLCVATALHALGRTGPDVSPRAHAGRSRTGTSPAPSLHQLASSRRSHHCASLSGTRLHQCSNSANLSSIPPLAARSTTTT